MQCTWSISAAFPRLNNKQLCHQTILGKERIVEKWEIYSNNEKSIIDILIHGSTKSAHKVDIF